MDAATAADLLDALSTWIVSQRPTAALTDRPHDRRLTTAVEKAQIDALRVYRSTGSLDRSFEAAKRTFWREAGSVLELHPSYAHDDEIVVEAVGERVAHG